MRFLLQPGPIIVDVGQPAETTPDISLDFVVGMFAMAGVFLLAALIGSAVVAGVILLRARRREASASAGAPTHTRLQIDQANEAPEAQASAPNARA